MIFGPYFKNEEEEKKYKPRQTYFTRILQAQKFSEDVQGVHKSIKQFVFRAGFVSHLYF